MEQLDSGDAEHLQLLARPELGVTFSKINAWRLTQYSKCVFLDADTLVIQNVDELFEREELSAAPDIGWPDCFNSGVFVFEPSLKTFYELIDLSRQTGSFDGQFCREARIRGIWLLGSGLRGLSSDRTSGVRIRGLAVIEYYTRVRGHQGSTVYSPKNFPLQFSTLCIMLQFIIFIAK